MSKHVQLVHLSREINTAIELAILAPAPDEIVHRLATASGMLGAFLNLQLHDPHPLLTRTMIRATGALAAWGRWQREHPPNASA